LLKRFECAQRRLLNNVLGVMPDDPPRKVVGRIQVRQDFPSKSRVRLVQ